MKCTALAVIAGVLLAGCAILPPEPPPSGGIFKKENLVLSESGRFSIQVLSADRETLRGAQGRFERLRFETTQPERVVLDVVSWIGPLGQTLGRIETRTSISDRPRYRVLDSQNQLLDVRRQGEMIKIITGERIPDDEVGLMIAKLMDVFTGRLEPDAQGRRVEFSQGLLRFEVRLVLDQTR